MGGDPLRWPRDTLYPKKLVLTSSTSGGRLVCIVRSRTKATEFSFFNFYEWYWRWVNYAFLLEIEDFNMNGVTQMSETDELHDRSCMYCLALAEVMQWFLSNILERLGYTSCFIEHIA
jgi:hypothetical protein